MLRIDSFIHRSSLSEMISRWMVGKPAPGDVMRLKTIVNFNWYIARLWIDWFARDLLEAFHGVAPIRYPINTKGSSRTSQSHTRAIRRRALRRCGFSTAATRKTSIETRR